MSTTSGAREQLDRIVLAENADVDHPGAAQLAAPALGLAQPAPAGACTTRGWPEALAAAQGDQVGG